jgi:transcriptional regulator with XRE-family HTH domain
MKPTLNTVIGRRLRKIRSEKGLTQQALAELLGVHQSTVSRMEAGDLPWTVETIAATSSALGVSSTDLSGSAMDDAA